MGGRPAGCAPRAAPALGGLPGGRLPQHQPRARRRCRRASATCCAASARAPRPASPDLPIPVVSASHEPRTEGRARHLVRPRVVPRRARRGAVLLMDPVWSERCCRASTSGRAGCTPCRCRSPGWAGSTPSSSRTTTTTTSTWTPSASWSSLTNAVFLVPLGVGAHLDAWGVPRLARRRVRLGGGARRARACGSPPSRPSTSPGAGLRRDGTLWASWVLAGAGGQGLLQRRHRLLRRVRPASATEHGPFDVSLMAVGAYDPAWHDIHLDPEEAVEATRLMRGGLLMPIHWCTFVLAPHPWAEPVERLLVAAADAGRAGGRAAGRRAGRRGRSARSGPLVGAAAGRRIAPENSPARRSGHSSREADPIPQNGVWGAMVCAVIRTKDRAK